MATFNPTPEVNTSRGSPLGRASSMPLNASHKIGLCKVPLDRGGYDAGGAYWGTGMTLWCAYEHGGEGVVYLRARDREDAKKRVRENYVDDPERVRFFR